MSSRCRSNCRRSAKAFDEHGNTYAAKKPTFGGEKFPCYFGAKFLADTRVKLTIVFENVASDATKFVTISFGKGRFAQVPIQVEPATETASSSEALVTPPPTTPPTE